MVPEPLMVSVRIFGDGMPTKVMPVPPVKLIVPSLTSEDAELPSNSTYPEPDTVSVSLDPMVRFAMRAAPLSETVEPGVLMKTLSVKPDSPGLVPGSVQVSQLPQVSSGPNQLPEPPVQFEFR